MPIIASVLLKDILVARAERIPCILIDAHTAAKTNPKILATFEGCHGTIELFDPHRGDDKDDGRGRYKVRLQVPQTKQPTGRLAPGGMFSTGEIRYSGGKVVWLHPRHVLLAPMTAVEAVLTPPKGDRRTGQTQRDAELTISGRVIGYVRKFVAAGIADATNGFPEQVGSTGWNQTVHSDPVIAASMPSMLECVLA